jgi:1-acyl-sn-glycerol-3-phosphate acyltransferase
MIRAIFVAVITFAYILIVGTPFLIYTLLTGNTDPIYNLGISGAKLAVWLSGVHKEVHGLEKIPKHGAVIYMPNHQSNCDPPAVISVLPPVLVMAKKEFFQIPVLGIAMRRRGFIPIDRRNRERAIAAVDQAVRALKAGYSFLAFPEGTRSPDGRLQTFKKGLFVMAIKGGASIVPVSVSGGRKVMPKDKFAIYPGSVRITFHDAISTVGLEVADRQKVINQTRQAILTGLDPEEWPAEPAGATGSRDTPVPS